MFEVVNKGCWINFNERETLQHNNIITSFVRYKNIIIYIHNKIFTIFLNYILPPILLTNITLVTYLLSIT